MSAVAVGDLLEVEVQEEDGSNIWRPARVVACDAAASTFRACINGDGDFIEEYAPADEGSEWRIPLPDARPWLEALYEEGERLFAGRGAARVPSRSNSKPEVEEAAISVGSFLEVDVAGEDGSTSWKPAYLTALIDGGRFVARVNGEADFEEEYGPEDEGTEWRRPANTAERVRIAKAYATAAAEWALKCRAVASSSADPALASWKVERILQQRRLPKERGHAYEYLVKWVGWPLETATWEPESNLTSCHALLEQFRSDNSGPSPPRKRPRTKATKAAVAVDVDEQGAATVAEEAVDAQAAAVEEDGAEEMDAEEAEEAEEEGRASPEPNAHGNGEEEAFVDSMGRQLRARSRGQNRARVASMLSAETREDSGKSDAESSEKSASVDESDDDDDDDDDEAGSSSADEEDGPRKRSMRKTKGGGTKATGKATHLERLGGPLAHLMFHETDDAKQRLSDAADAAAVDPPCLPSLMPSLDVLLRSGPHVIAVPPPPPPPPPPPIRLCVSLSPTKGLVAPKKPHKPPPPAKKKGKAKATSEAAGDGEEATSEFAIVGSVTSLKLPEAPNNAEKHRLPLYATRSFACAHADGEAQLCNAGASIWGVAWRRRASPTEASQLAVGTYAAGATHNLAGGANAIQIWEVTHGPASSRSSRGGRGRGGGGRGRGGGDGGTGVSGRPRMWLELMHPGGGVLALSWAPTGNACSAPSREVQGGASGARGRDGGSCTSLAVAADVIPAAPTVDRLGLIAAACADGRIRIFAVPTEDSLIAAEPQLAHDTRRHVEGGGGGSGVNAPFRLWLPPALQLETQAPVLTLSIDWCASSTHLLAAGLDDGTVTVWDMSETARQATPRAPPPRGAVDAARGEGIGEGDRGEDGSDDEEESDHEPGDAGEAEGEAAAAVEAEIELYSTALGVLSVPLVTLGCSSSRGGDISRFFSFGSTASSIGLGHAGPVRSVRWSHPPHEFIASVGHDGVLMVWDHASGLPQRQSHKVAQYHWAVDLAWAPAAPAIFVATDAGALRLMALRDEILLPALHTTDKERAKLFRYYSDCPGARPFAFGCDVNATVWALSVSAGGERMAGVTSDGRLEVIAEERQRVGRKHRRTALLGTAIAQLCLVQERSTAEADGASEEVPPTTTDDAIPTAERDEAAAWLHVGLDQAARPALPTVAAQFAPSRSALRCVAWCPDEHEPDEWIAAGGTAGLLLILPATRS